jgi:hypothetical protein
MDGITHLCRTASAMGCVVLSVPDLGGPLGLCQTPMWCVFTLPAYGFLTPDEKDTLYAHVRHGGTLIFLDRAAASDEAVLAHEIGHVAVFLAGKDRDFRKPHPKLRTKAKRCGFDDASLESNDELMAECVGRRILGLPLYPHLVAFSEEAFRKVQQI